MAARAKSAAPIIMSPEEARKYLGGMGRNQFYEAVRCGKIPGFKIKQRLFIPRAGLDKLIAAALEPKTPAV